MLAKSSSYAVLMVLAAVCASGCYRSAPNASRWEKPQPPTSSATAEPPSAEYDSGVAAEPPPWNPEGAPPAGTADQGPKWKVGDKPRSSAGDTAKPRRPHIDLENLKAGDVLPGSEFNKFFPRQEGKWDLVYKQEKKGFALASLQRGGEEIALLSITDLRSNPEAADKYLQPTGEIHGYPSVEVGSKGTGVLVAGRFQVQVRSASADFASGDRAEWIGRFDLSGLEGLQ